MSLVLNIGPKVREVENYHLFFGTGYLYVLVALVVIFVLKGLGIVNSSLEDPP